MAKSLDVAGVITKPFEMQRLAGQVADILGLEGMMPTKSMEPVTSSEQARASQRSGDLEAPGRALRSCRVGWEP